MEQSPYSMWWLPLDASAHGAGVDHLINVIHIFMLVLFVGWGAYFVYCLIRFRARSGHKADPTPRHFRFPTYVEIAVAVVEVCLLVFVSYPIWAKVKNDLPSEKESTVINVTAEQFAWNIHYPGKDGKFGKTVLEKIDGTNPVGLDREDPAAKDDILTINQLHVPVNKPVLIYLRSKDVIHSFALPIMRVKQDAVPGTTQAVWFIPVKTGEFEIACAQLCGNSHFRMRGSFVVHTQEDYDKWMAEQEKELAGEQSTASVPADNTSSGS